MTAVCTTIPSGEVSPIHSAAASGRIGAIRDALAHGADPNARWFGVTPLILAADARQAAAVEVLLAHGADHAIASQQTGLLALHHAVHGANWTDPSIIQWILLRDTLATVDALLAGGADIHASAKTDRGFITVLDAASHSMHLMDALIARGCGVADFALRHPLRLPPRTLLALTRYPRCLALAWLHDAARAAVDIQPPPPGLTAADIEWMSSQIATAFPPEIAIRAFAALGQYAVEPLPFGVRVQALRWAVTIGCIEAFQRLTGWRRRTLL